MNLLILGANGQIARLVEDQILQDPKYKDVNLTLFLRDKNRLADLQDNPRVTLVQGDLTEDTSLNKAMEGQDLVFLATVDTDTRNQMTKNVIEAMKHNGVDRLLASSSIGIYGEEPNPGFHRWNQSALGGAIPGMRQADELLAKSGLKYTTMRFAWLNNRRNNDYAITVKGEPMAGAMVSRQAVADAILTLIADPNQYVDETIGIADPATKNEESAY